MSSVGFQSKLPSVADFMANQGAFIDAAILNIVIGSANAETVSAGIAAQAARLNGLMSRATSFAETQVKVGNLVETIAKPELEKLDQKDADWAARQTQNPVPPFGKAPSNFNEWNVNTPLQYAEDADAKYLRDRGLPVAFYVPAQSKVVQVPNPAHQQLQSEIAGLQNALNATSDPLLRLALQVQISLKQTALSVTPATNSVTLTAPQIGSPDAYRINRETIAKYKAQLEDGTADNPVINAATAASGALNELSGDLDELGVAKPKKFKDLGAAVVQVQSAADGLDTAIEAARADLLKLLDQAGEAVDFVNQLAEDLTRSGHRAVDKLQEKLSGASALAGVDLGSLEPQIRALVEAAVADLEGAVPPGNSRAALAALPPDQQREALQQISAFQQELEALLGASAPPTAAPAFQASSRLVRV